MKIKEVIIDGFKSYANRTVVRDFDPSFNAITGLNGSGKSNILDAICFVLGLSNLSHVRVSNLQQLIYKQGQARVNKASVTIVFDNSDPASSPYGFKEFKEITVTRQIVVGGRGKYLLNGATAQFSRIKNLFESVQLNVNNPHFLIMQGRITKVINMKPVEILGMIQEAAGTRMYERQKEKAEKTIDNKQSKVNEINSILSEEIAPQMDKLRKERSSFIKWTANKTELEKLSRLVTAWRFTEAERSEKNAQDEREAAEARLDGLRQAISDVSATIEQHQNEQGVLTKSKAEKMRGSYQRYEEEVKKQSLGLVKVTSEWENCKKSLEAEQVKLEKLRGQKLANLNKAILDKQAQIEAANAAASDNETLHKNLVDEIASLQGQLLGVRMGSDSGSSVDKGSLADQLMEVEKMISRTQGQLEQNKTKRGHLVKELVTKEKELKSMQKKFQTQEKELAKLETDLERLQAKLERESQQQKGQALDGKARSKLMKEIGKIEDQVSRIKEQIQLAEARAAQWSFDYTPPVKNWDHRRVKGLVAELISVEDSKFTTAVEVIAGARMFNVVVDTQETGKLLLDKGKLRRRVTILPLNRIAANRIDSLKIERAQQIVGKDNAFPALSVIGYDEELERVMELVFGGSIVCTSIQAAEKVAYHPEIRVRGVTLEGDTFDPQGTLTGGSRSSNQPSLLEQMQRLSKLKTELQSLEDDLEAKTQQLKSSDEAEQASLELQQQIQLQEHNLALTKSRLGQSQYAQTRAEVEQAQAELKELDTVTTELKAERKAAQDQAKQLTQRIQRFEKERESQRKQCQKELAAAKQKLQKFEATVKKSRDSIQVLQLELDQLQEEASQMEVQCSQLEASIKDLEEQLQQFASSVDSKKQDYDRATDKFESEKERLSQNDERIAELQQTIGKLQKTVSTHTLEIKKLEHQIVRFQQDSKDAAKRVFSILRQNKWIKAERQMFNKPNTDYDFESMGNMNKAQQRLEALTSEQADLEKQINKKVMGMFERAEQEAADLMSKRDIIMMDKQKIEEVIAELDHKKNEALEVTWKKVNGFFGSIFSTLLPGAHAKLQPPEDAKTILDGLEVRVGFDGVWKQSLSELSGGQRSLLALSLILALLRFKPAPMYILDEIDAALDLSHTQNIGMMLRKHFPESQFIVVSLKEGMFNNANVIYRTEFVDGVSTVKRTVPKGSSAASAQVASAKPGRKRRHA